MDHAAFLGYFVALAALTAAPGPIVTVLVARSIGGDTRGAVAFALGLTLADVLAVFAVAMGVGVWAESKPEWFALAKYAGVAYLLWLSIGMWNDRSASSASRPRSGSLLAAVGAGIALCLGNPSTVLIYVLLLPTVAPTGIHGMEQLSIVMLVTFAAVGMVFFGTIVLARQVSRVIKSPASSTTFSRVTAGLVALTSVWILAV